MREVVDVGLLRRTLERRDIGDAVNGEAGEAPALVGDDQTRRPPLTWDAQDVREIEDRQHLAVEVAQAQHPATRAGDRCQLAEVRHLEHVLDRQGVGLATDPQSDVHAAHGSGRHRNADGGHTGHPNGLECALQIVDELLNALARRGALGLFSSELIGGRADLDNRGRDLIGR